MARGQVRAMLSRISSGRLTKLTVGGDEEPLKIVDMPQGRKNFPLLTYLLTYKPTVNHPF